MSKIGQPEFMPEFAGNQESRVPCVLLLDTSGSMEGEPIDQLNEGLKVYAEAISNDPIASLRVETAIITFGGRVKVIQEFAAIDELEIPELDAGGGTPMGKAILRGIEILENRKADYKAAGIPSYRPWMFIVTDGSPTDLFCDPSNAVHSGEAEGKFSFFAVAVEGADMDTLSSIAPPNRPPVMLKGLNFSKLFEWISHSLTKISHSKSANEEVVLDPIANWGTVSS